MLRIYRPEVFQGNLKKKNYFEGWYYKHVSADLRHTFSFIPGISLNETDPHAFIQVINGSTGYSQYITYPLEEFSWEKRRLYLKVGQSVFTDSYISLNISSTDLNINGKLEYKNIVHYPKTLFSPGIMGWYSFVPFMECKHGMISVNHDLSGELLINSDMVDFYEGKGYIEKDWGTSFPESWLWIQANNFNDHDTSLSFSVAKIPWRNKFFIGFIAFLYFGGRFYRFSTYNGASITELYRSGKSVFLTMKDKRFKLRIKLVRNNTAEIKAPVSGMMTRKIKESIDSRVSLALHDHEGKIIYTDTSQRAGFEQIEKIFEYFQSNEIERTVKDKVISDAI